MIQHSSQDTPCCSASTRNTSKSRRPDLALRHYWRPRYWGTWVLYLLLHAIARLPFRAQLAVGKRAGRLAYRLLPRKRHIVTCNLAACFPELGSDEREDLVHKHFESTGMSIAEAAIGWLTPLRRYRHRIKVEGREHLDRAISSERGIILLSAHFTPLEIGFAITRDLCPSLDCVYRPQHNAMMNALILRGRSRTVDEQISRDDIRGLIRRLRAGGIVAFFPDQAHVEQQGALLPFFGVPAVANTATSKIARCGNAIVLPYMFRRLPGLSGYTVNIFPPLDVSADEDDVEWTRGWTRIVEDYIRQAPEQYLWTYKKFKGRPSSLPDLYAKTPTQRRQRQR